MSQIPQALVSVTASPDGIIAEIKRMFSSVPAEAPKGLDAVRLLNEALISQEAAAQLVLGIAAVEHLAQGETWTEPQLKALQRLAALAESDDTLRADEATELADILRNSVHRVSIRQSHKRLLKALDLESLWKPWDSLYSRRSAILHGLTYSSNADRSQIVHPALSLCARIVLSAISREVAGAADELDVIFPMINPDS